MESTQSSVISPQHFLEPAGDLRARHRPALQSFAFGGIVLGAVEGEPDGAQTVGVVGRARKQMPVQVRHQIAEQLVIELVRSEATLDRASEQAHLFQISATRIVGEATQLGGVLASNEDAVAGVE